MGNQETAWPYRIDRPIASAPEPTPETTNLPQTLADLGQPHSSRETTIGDMNTAEKQEDKDTAENEENKAKNKLKEITDMQSPQSVTVSAYDRSAVTVNVNILNGNIVVARGHNTGYPHVTAPQPPQPMMVLAHEQTAVNININILNGDVIDLRGHNADHQHVPVPQPPESIIVLAHEQTVVNINVNSLNGDIVGALGDNTGYQNVSVSQHTPGPQRALDHPHDYGRCDSYRPNYSRHR